MQSGALLCTASAREGSINPLVKRMHHTGVKSLWYGHAGAPLSAASTVRLSPASNIPHILDICSAMNPAIY